MQERLDISKSLWPLNTFYGRFMHFMWVTDPRTVVVPSSQLYQAKELVTLYKNGLEPSGTSLSEVLRAKKLFESSFHPDSGELQNFAGRMSFQLPGGMALLGAMLAFYRSNGAVIFWQFTNQSFNALVNYTNRNAKAETNSRQLGIAYVSATFTALVTALGCKKYFATRAGPLVQRFVPFIAVAAANCVNLPLMRQNEILHGVRMTDDHGNEVATSRYAAIKGISQVVLSRIVISAPGMLLVPVIMENWLEKIAFVRRNIKIINLPAQLILSGLTLIVMVPAGCALFPQQCSIKITRLSLLDNSEYQRLQQGDTPIPEKLYFNKGL